MEITLLRTNKTNSETRGVLGVGNDVFGYTIEHPVIDKLVLGLTPALKEDVYKLEVRNNPSSGTPIIKVIGKYVPSNISIRNSKPFSISNSSIALVSTQDSKGEVKPVDYQAWLKLLDFISKQEEVNLRINLLAELEPPKLN